MAKKPTKPTVKSLAQKPTITIAYNELDNAFFKGQKVFRKEQENKEHFVIGFSSFMTPEAYEKTLGNKVFQKMMQSVNPKLTSLMVNDMIREQRVQAPFFKNFDMSLDSINLKKQMLEKVLTQDMGRDFMAMFRKDVDDARLVIPQKCMKMQGKFKTDSFGLLLQKDAPFIITDDHTLLIKCRFDENILSQDEIKRFLVCQTDARYDSLFASDPNAIEEDELTLEEKQALFKEMQDRILETLTDEQKEKSKKFVADFGKADKEEEFICEIPLDALFFLVDDHKHEFPYLWEESTPSCLKKIEHGILYVMLQLIEINCEWQNGVMLNSDRVINAIESNIDSFVFALKNLVNFKTESMIEKSVLSALESTLTATASDEIEDIDRYFSLLDTLDEQLDVLFNGQKTDQLFEDLRDVYRQFDVR